MNTHGFIECNKLICEFMGYQIKGSDFIFPSEMQWLYIPSNIYELEDGVYNFDCDVSSMKFHFSWDWLIPVIDKITSMNEYSKFVDHTCSMVSKGGIHINTRFIETTWSDVVDFIKWYNQNKH